MPNLLRILLLVAFCLLCALAVANPALVLTPRAYIEQNDCSLVTEGMTESEVEQIMGKPQSRATGYAGTLILSYREPAFASAPPQIWLELRNGAYVVSGQPCIDLG